MAKKPGRKTFKSKTTKRKFKRKPRAKRGESTWINKSGKEIGKRVIGIARTLDVFPKTWFVKFKYSESSYIVPTAQFGLSAIGEQYSTNCVFDPRYSLGGKQPLWYDQVAPYYARIWVHYIQVELEMTNPSEDGFFCGYRVRTVDDAGVPTAGQNLDFLQQAELTDMRPINNTGSQITKFKFNLHNYKIFGISKVQYQDNAYSHLNVGRPTYEALIEPFAFATVSNDQTIRYNIKITYFCELTNRVTPTES